MALPYPHIEKESYTEDEYFAFERDAFGRWEYVAGQIRAMSSGTDDHSVIAMNIGGTLRSMLIPRGCRVYGADMKIHTGNGVNTFPDIAVVCGPREYYRGKTDIITNPVLIVEVLSLSTQGYDRGEKFDHYKAIPTLTDYLLVMPTEPRVLLYTRHADHWDFREISGRENSVDLPSVELAISLADIYALIDFTDPNAAL